MRSSEQISTEPHQCRIFSSSLRPISYIMLIKKWGQNSPCGYPLRICRLCEPSLFPGFFLGFAVGVLEFVLNHLFELLRLDPD